MDKIDNIQNLESISKESLKNEDDRISNIPSFNEGDSEILSNSNDHELKKIDENYLIDEEENSNQKKIFFSPSIPTKINSNIKLFKSQKSFLVQNQEKTSKKLSNIKASIENTIEKYSDKIQNEMTIFNNSYRKNYEDITKRQKEFYEKDIKLYIKNDINELWDYISLREELNKNLIKSFIESSDNTIQEMLNEIKTLIENYVNGNPAQPIHFLLEESYKANKTAITTKENILLLCKKLLLNDANVFMEFQISRRYFENEWSKKRIPFLIDEFGNKIKENSQYFNFEYSDIQKKFFFYYSNQIDQVNALIELKYEDINEEYLKNWQDKNENINNMLDIAINDLASEYMNYDKLRVKFIDDLKEETKNMILECNENIDADHLISNKLSKEFSNYTEDDFSVIYNKIRSCLKKNKEIMRILGEIFLVLISIKSQQIEYVNGIEKIIDDKIKKDFDESKKDIIIRKEQLNAEIDNLRKAEFEPNITNKYNEIKEILKNYENDYRKVIDTIENDMKLCNKEMNSCFEKYKIAIYNLLALKEMHQKSRNDNISAYDKKKHTANNHEIKKKNYYCDSVNVMNTKSSININNINGYSYEGEFTFEITNNYDYLNFAIMYTNENKDKKIVPFDFNLEDLDDVKKVNLNIIPHDLISNFRTHFASLLVRNIDNWKEESEKILYKNLNVKLKKLKNKFNQEFYHNNEEDAVYEEKLAEISDQKSQAIIESEILIYNIEEMKKNYKNTIIDLESRANKIIEEMNDYINIPSEKITSDVHHKFDRKTKEKIDQLKILVDKATEEYNNKRLMIKQSRIKNPYAWEIIPNGEKLYEDIKPYYNSFNQKIFLIQENLENNLLDINNKIKMRLFENQFYETIKKSIKTFNIKILSSIFKIKNFNKEINEAKNMIDSLYKELEKKQTMAIVPKILSYVYTVKKKFNSLGIYLLGFNDELDKNSYYDMMKSIKFIEFEEWLKRDKIISKKLNRDNSADNAIIKNKDLDINNIKEVLESNFEEMIIEMKNSSYNSVIAIGESFFKDPSNYSEKYPDINKFKEYVNDEFSRMIDDITNKKEIFIDDYEKKMEEILYNISNLISRKLFKTIYLNIQKTQNIQWLERMRNFDKEIQGILQRNDIDISLIKPYCNKIELEKYKEKIISEKENKLLDVDNIYNEIYNICYSNIKKFSECNLYVTEILYNIMGSPSYRKKTHGIHGIKYGNNNRENNSNDINTNNGNEFEIKKEILEIDYNLLKMDFNIKTPFKVSSYTDSKEAYNNGFLNVIEHRNKYIKKFFTEYNDHIIILNSLISKFKEEILATSNKKYMYIDALYVHQGFNN